MTASGMGELRQACAGQRDWLVDTIGALARIESPSGDVDALDRCGDAITAHLSAAGAAVERLPQSAGAHLRGTIGDGTRQVLLLGHFDTVWPIGTLAQMPVEIRDGRLHGPGTFDMKAGLAIADVSRYWLHQANLNMNLLIIRTLLGRDATPEEAPVILDTYANTSSAGSIIAFHKYQDDLPSGANGVICSFGAGYSIGCVVVRKK